MITREQVYSIARYLIELYGPDAQAVAQRKSDDAVALRNPAGIHVWNKVRAALDELAPEEQPTIH